MLSEVDHQERDGRPISASPPIRGSGEPRSPWIVLGLLLLVHLSSSMDRFIVSIAGQEIKQDFALADWQLGLLTGFAFSVLYVLCGFPLARLADRSNRVTIISVCLVVWSGMTALCGLSANFGQLIVSRMGVGIGEAGCLPPSHSLITDYFPGRRRTTAIACFGLGLPLGALVGMIAGGAAIDSVGWRATFVIIGLPGLLLAAAVWFVIREPRVARDGRSVGHATLPTNVVRESFSQVAKGLFANVVTRHVLLGMMLATLFTSPSLTFLAPYIVRAFGLSYGQVGVVIGGAQMGGMALATICAGLLADRLGRRDSRWYFWVPAGSMLFGGPLLILAFAQPDWQALMLVMFAASLVSAAYLAPSYAVLYAAVRPHWRATTAAIAGAMMSMGGSSVGPLVCGAMIDWLTPLLFEHTQHASFVTVCAGGSHSTGAADLTIASCRAAMARSTQISLIALSLFCLWPGLHFLHAARLWKRHGGADFVH